MSICNNILDNVSTEDRRQASKIIFKTMIKKHHKIHRRTRDSVRRYLQRGLNSLINLPSCIRVYTGDLSRIFSDFFVQNTESKCFTRGVPCLLLRGNRSKDT